MPTKDPVIAAILSFLLPGLGQFYCRRWGRGVGFLLGVALLAVLFPPFGFLLALGLWVWAIADAYRAGLDSEAQGRPGHG